MSDALTQILQTTGIAGAVLVVCALALKSVYERLNAVQEKRIADAQLFTAKLLELVDSQHKNNETLADAVNACAEAQRETRVLLESLLQRPRNTRGG
jgi:hypothetical protein